MYLLKQQLLKPTSSVLSLYLASFLFCVPSYVVPLFEVHLIERKQFLDTLVHDSLS